MRKMKNAALVIVGILVGIAVSGPAARAGLMANISSQQFYLDGQRVNLEAYEINGSNYVKLRDVGQAVDFGISYDAATNSVNIRPDQPYEEAVKAPAAPSTGDDTLTNGKPVTEENVLALLRQVEKDWPSGTVWGTHNTPGTHKNEIPSTISNRIMNAYKVSGEYGCGAYASMVSSLIFGDKTNPARELEDLSRIRPGDIIFRVDNKTGKVWHVTIALESPNEINAFHITDGNCGETVYWPDAESPYSRDNLDCYRGDLADYHLEVWTRYPEGTPYTGASANAWFPN